MAATAVCAARCRLLTKLEINRVFHFSTYPNRLTNTRESWCRRWRPQHAPLSTCSVLCKDSKSTVEVEKGDDRRSSSDSNEGVVISYSNGLPVLTMPLPSRRERCRFTLRPVSQTVGDFLEQVKAEDRGVERAVAMAAREHVRIAASNTVESLLEDDFRLLVNDTEYYVKHPPQEKMNKDEAARLSDVRTLVSQLYAALNVREHHVCRERQLRAQLETLRHTLAPLEQKRLALDMEASRRTSMLTWLGLSLMGVQFGVLARLTWWEYSWDIMEPVTYFVTYGTAMAGYAYYVLTKQEYVLPDVKDRQHLLTLHKRARKIGLDINQYNVLKNEISKIQDELSVIQDSSKVSPKEPGAPPVSGDRSTLDRLRNCINETTKKLKLT